MPRREANWKRDETEPGATPVSDAELAAADVNAGFDTTREAATEEAQPRGRGRTRRRRGRGRRGGEGQQSADRNQRASNRADSNQGQDTEYDDLGVEQDELEFDADHGERDGVGFETDEDFGDVAAVGHDELATTQRGHRSIPSWEDAIGMIVESNLQSRTERRQFSNSGRRGGSSRGGRSRGGRRHGPQNGQ
jgi:hypothetical protein